MQKNVTLYCPLYVDLYYAVCRFYFFPITSSYKAYFLRTNRSYIFKEQFLLHASTTTYLKDLTQSICRYGGLPWQNWFKGCLEALVVSLLGAKNLASMRGRGKLNMLDDPRQYNVYSDIGKHNPLSYLPCPTLTF